MRKLALIPHNDDDALFLAYTLIREKPLVLLITDSYIQPERGDQGCSAEERRAETIKAMEILGCPVAFLGIKDTELTSEILERRLRDFGQFEEVFIPAIQGGNKQHDIVGEVGGRLFKDTKSYTTYTKSELYTTGRTEVVPTNKEIELKEKAIWCYQSQINLPSTRPHFEAVLGGKSEWYE